MDKAVIDLKVLRKKPLYAILLGLIFVLVGFSLSIMIFPSDVSMVMITLSSLFILPFVIKTFELDDLNANFNDYKDREDLLNWIRKCLDDGFTPGQIKESLIRGNTDEGFMLIYNIAGVDEEYAKYLKSSNFISRHKEMILFYVFLFVGMFFGYYALFAFLPQKMALIAFQNQVNVISPSQGFFSLIPANRELFYSIVSNNLKIIFLCISLSVVYGSGAIFILNYNASIAGVLFGNSLRALLGSASAGGVILSNPVLYLPHTSIEIFGYLLAAISGGILSRIVMLKQEPGCSQLLLKDSICLLILSVILIIVGGYLEILVI